MQNKLLIIFFILILPHKFYTQELNVKLNPSGFTPLSALLILPENNKTPIVIHTFGKKKEDTIAVVYPPNSGKELPIHGLYPNFTNQIAIKIGKSRPQKMSIVTQPLQISNLKKKDLMRLKTKVTKNIIPQNSPFNYDLYFTSVINARDVLGFDQKGDIRYSYRNLKEKPTLIRMEVDKNNISMLYIVDSKCYVKRDLMGKEIFRKKYEVHHDTTDYSNHHELILGNSKWGWEDMVFELNAQKNIIKEYSIGDVFRQAISERDSELLKKLIFDNKNIYIHKNLSRRIDWAHANSLVYDMKKDRLYVSLRHLGVVAIKYRTWTLEWFMVADDLKTTDGFSYGKKPKESVYLVDIPSLQKYRMNTKKGAGPRGQHALFLKANGNLLLFDNQSNGTNNTKGSRVVEYQFNEDTKKATIVREFKDSSYSRYVGDVDLIGKDRDNWLLFFGHSDPRRIVEVDPDNKVLFQLDIVLEGMMYRVDKFPLYKYLNKNKKYSLDALEDRY